MLTTNLGGGKLHPYADEYSRVGAKVIFARICFSIFLLFFAINSHPTEKKSIPLTIEKIANASFSINKGGNIETVKLKNGHFERRKKGSDTLSVDLTTWVKFTDLDKDGSQDAAVIFVWNKGGEEIFYELAAILNKNGKPVYFSSVSLGDRVVIQALEVSADTVFLNMRTRGKGDASCCPTLPVKLSYLLGPFCLTEQTDYRGIYEGKATLKNGVTTKMKMSINGDDTVKMAIKYLNGDPDEINIGKWYNEGDGSLRIVFSGGSCWPSGLDLILRFLDDKLISMFHYDEIYGEGDLEFEKVSQ